MRREVEDIKYETDPSKRELRRVFLIVLDSLGVGAMPDAESFGDAGSHTLDHICEAAGQPEAPRLMSLGLGNIEGVEKFPAAVIPEGAFGRMAEASAGKDTTTGHWEMTGVPLDRAFPVFPDGFEESFLDEVAKATKLPGWLGNVPASGTAIIEKHGEEHIATGKPIVYTSADSVMQIAAHEEHFGLNRLLRLCQILRERTLDLGIARIIARPFIDAPEGSEDRYERTYNRRDFSLVPPKKTILDHLKAAGVPVVGIGKIGDIFSGQGLTKSVHTKGNDDGMVQTEQHAKELVGGLVFVNLVDFDMNFGHRRDPAGYRQAIEEFDRALQSLEYQRRDEDIVILTADHGNDPTKTEHTDHTREYVPVLMYGQPIKGNFDLGTRATFADLGATVAEALGAPFDGPGTSFYKDALK